MLFGRGEFAFATREMAHNPDLNLVQVQARYTKLLQKYDESNTGKLDEEEFAVMLQVSSFSLSLSSSALSGKTIYEP